MQRMPRPLDLPPGFSIHMLEQPSVRYWRHRSASPASTSSTCRLSTDWSGTASTSLNRRSRAAWVSSSSSSTQISVNSSEFPWLEASLHNWSDSEAS
eukprot:scaffold561813_cov39-Prasinocladus_malaysianus.AAC.1